MSESKSIESETPAAVAGAAPGSAILLMFKATKQTKVFNLGQKLWVVRLTGAMAAHVRGKYRGKHRYVKSWVRWDKKGDALPDIKEIPVTKEFYDRIRSDAESDEGYAHLLSPNDRAQQPPPEESIDGKGGSQ